MDVEATRADMEYMSTEIQRVKANIAKGTSPSDDNSGKTIQWDDKDVV